MKLIKPDTDQPRKTFDQAGLQQLADNMKLEGLIHPIELDKDNFIIVGERRWRAAQLLKWKKINVLKGDLISTSLLKYSFNYIKIF